MVVMLMGFNRVLSGRLVRFLPEVVGGSGQKRIIEQWLDGATEAQATDSIDE